MGNCCHHGKYRNARGRYVLLRVRRAGASTLGGPWGLEASVKAKARICTCSCVPHGVST